MRNLGLVQSYGIEEASYNDGHPGTIKWLQSPLHGMLTE